jgi:hypothetical protein
MASTTEACVSICSFVPSSKASKLNSEKLQDDQHKRNFMLSRMGFFVVNRSAVTRLLRYFYYSVYLLYWYKSTYTDILFVVKRLAAKRLLRYPIFLLLSLLVQKYKY